MWAMSGQYLSMHLELKIKITLKCKPNGYLRYDIVEYIISPAHKWYLKLKLPVCKYWHRFGGVWG
jgi:hypothetical protein